MNRSCGYGSRCDRRSGISLLEVVLALALVGIAISLLSQLVTVGSRAAAFSRDIAKAQLICESVMAEIMSGVQPLPTGGQAATPATIDPNFTYEVEVQLVSVPTATQNLSSVRVSVRRISSSTRAASFSMTQWYWTPPVPETDELTTDEGAL